VLVPIVGINPDIEKVKFWERSEAILPKLRDAGSFS